MKIDLTNYEAGILRGMLRQRIGLIEQLEKSIENLAFDGGPEQRVLAESSSALQSIRVQRDELEGLLGKLIVYPVGPRPDAA